jgi:hypothetical protein
MAAAPSFSFAGGLGGPALGGLPLWVPVVFFVIIFLALCPAAWLIGAWVARRCFRA